MLFILHLIVNPLRDGKLYWKVACDSYISIDFDTDQTKISCFSVYPLAQICLGPGHNSCFLYHVSPGKLNENQYVNSFLWWLGMRKKSENWSTCCINFSYQTEISIRIILSVIWWVFFSFHPFNAMVSDPTFNKVENIFSQIYPIRQI